MLDKIIKELEKQCKKAIKEDEIPVAAVIVKDNKIIASAHNTRQKKHSCINHAEILAILRAEKKLKDWRLDSCCLYVTLEPCSMCKEIIVESRIKSTFYFVDSNYKNIKKTSSIIKIQEKNVENKFLTLFQQYFKFKR